MFFRPRTLHLLLTALALVAAMSRPAAASPQDGGGNTNGGNKVDRAVREGVRSGAATLSVIITVKAGHRDSIRQSLRNHGDVIKSDHPFIDAVAVELHSGDVDELANHPWVEAVSADARVSAKGEQADKNETNKNKNTNSTTYSLANQPSQTLANTLRETLGLPSVATGSSANGVTVALIDSGIAPSDDFAGRITGFYDFTHGGIPTAPYDDYGHGTHIAGLIGSSGQLSNYQYQGIAPDVHLVGLKVLDGTGSGKTSDVIKAIEYVIANRSRLNVQVINLSLGHPIYAPAKYDPLVQAVEKASAAGLIVVTASGNFGQKQTTGEPGYTGMTSPGNAPSAITVGAVMTRDTVTRDDDAVAPYSGRGPSWFDGYAKPDVVAPGHHLLSDTNLSSYLYAALQLNRGQAKNGQPLLQLSGTSMAAGVTTGVVALLLQAHNQADHNGNHDGDHDRTRLTTNLVKAMLQFTAIPVAGADYLTQGAGEINAAGAIALASNIDTDAAAGAWWLNTGLEASTVIGGVTYPWSQHVIWADTVLTGNLVYVNNVVWSTNIVWGTAVSWGGHALIAGDNIVWGTAAIWATNIVWADRVLGLRYGDNIVWGTLKGDNIVWGTVKGDNIVWGTLVGDNIVWGTWVGDNIVWGTSLGLGDNIVWGTSLGLGDNIVWGTWLGDNIVWGKGDNIVWAREP